MVRTFVSHSYADEPAIEFLRKAAPDRELIVFPPQDVAGDEYVSERLTQAIRSADELVYIGAEKSDLSIWVAFEVDFAKRLGKKVHHFDSARQTLEADDEPPAVSDVILVWRPEHQLIGEQLLRAHPPERQFNFLNDRPQQAWIGERGFHGLLSMSISACSVYVMETLDLDKLLPPSLPGMEALQTQHGRFRFFRGARYTSLTEPIFALLGPETDVEAQIALMQMMAPGVVPHDICVLRTHAGPDGQVNINANDLDTLSAQICWRNTRQPTRTVVLRHFHVEDFDLPSGKASELLSQLRGRGDDDFANRASKAIETFMHARWQPFGDERLFALTVAIDHVTGQFAGPGLTPADSNLFNELIAYLSLELAELYLVRPGGVPAYNLLRAEMYAGIAVRRLGRVDAPDDAFRALAHHATALRQLGLSVGNAKMATDFLRTSLHLSGTLVNLPPGSHGAAGRARAIADAVVTASLLVENLDPSEARMWVTHAEQALATFRQTGEPAAYLDLLETHAERLRRGPEPEPR